MTLDNIVDWVVSQLIEYGSITIGKLNSKQEKSICVYNRESSYQVMAVGGLSNTSYKPKRICMLVHWTNNYNTAELKAQEVYSLLEGQHATINNIDCFFKMETDEPVALGADDNGIYEFAIEATIFYKRS